MKLPTLFLIAAFGLPGRAWNDNIMKVALASTSGIISENDQRCVAMAPNDKQECYASVPGFSPLTLRNAGKWSESAREAEYIKALDPYTLATMLEYPDFVVDSLSMSSDGRFMAEVSFKYGTDYQKNLVFGEVRRDLQGRPEAIVTSYADETSEQEERRITVKTFENIFASQRNFQSAVAQVRLEDLSRALAVQPVVQAALVSLK